MVAIPTYQGQPTQLGGTQKLSGSDPVNAALQQLGGQMQNLGGVIHKMEQEKQRQLNEKDLVNLQTDYNEQSAIKSAELSKRMQTEGLSADDAVADWEQFRTEYFEKETEGLDQDVIDAFDIYSIQHTSKNKIESRTQSAKFASAAYQTAWQKQQYLSENPNHQFTIMEDWEVPEEFASMLPEGGKTYPAGSTLSGQELNVYASMKRVQADPDYIDNAVKSIQTYNQRAESKRIRAMSEIDPLAAQAEFDPSKVPAQDVPFISAQIQQNVSQMETYFQKTRQQGMKQLQSAIKNNEMDGSDVEQANRSITWRGVTRPMFDDEELMVMGAQLTKKDAVEADGVKAQVTLKALQQYFDGDINKSALMLMMLDDGKAKFSKGTMANLLTTVVTGEEYLGVGYSIEGQGIQRDYSKKQPAIADGYRQILEEYISAFDVPQSRVSYDLSVSNMIHHLAQFSDWASKNEGATFPEIDEYINNTMRIKDIRQMRMIYNMSEIKMQEENDRITN